MRIQKVAVLGAGVMGQGISAHLANAGIPSLLFDIPPKEGSDVRAVAKAGIANLAKLKPAPLGDSAEAALIQQANYEEHLDVLKGCDLIIEAIAEMFLAGVIDADGVVQGGLAERTARVVPDGRTFSSASTR